MTDAGTNLSDEDRQLLLAHYRFYHSLDTGACPATTEAQQRFVAVCRGTAPPANAHELAYVNLQAFIRVSGIAESEMVSSGFTLVVPTGGGGQSASPAPAGLDRSEDALSTLTPRRRAIMKLRVGCLPLSEVELGKVVADKRSEAVEVRPRSLREVADLIGVSKERIRQIESSILGKLGPKAGILWVGNEDR